MCGFLNFHIAFGFYLLVSVLQGGLWADLKVNPKQATALWCWLEPHPAMLTGTDHTLRGSLCTELLLRCLRPEHTALDGLRS